MNEYIDLSGKVALISGCFQGLGYAAAVALAKCGADIFSVGIGDDTALRVEIERLGRRYASIHCDFESDIAIHNAMDAVLAEYHHIDIMLNYAALVHKTKTLNSAHEAWDEIVTHNVKSIFFLSQAVIKQFMRQNKGGKIINVSSLMAHVSSDEYAAYTACKGAMEALTRSLANEYGKYSIQVNAIAPGFMISGTRLQQKPNGDFDSTLKERIPARRWGTYKDIEALTILLSSKGSDYINGCIIPLDGGYSNH